MQEIRVDELKTDVKSHQVLLDKKNDDVKDLVNANKTKQKEIECLKKAIMNQQTFCEKFQKDRLSKNVVVAGITNDNLVYQEQIYESTAEKVAIIIHTMIVISTKMIMN